MYCVVFKHSENLLNRLCTLTEFEFKEVVVLKYSKNYN